MKTQIGMLLGLLLLVTPSLAAAEHSQTIPAVCPAWNFWQHQPDCQMALNTVGPLGSVEIRVTVDDPMCMVGSIDHVRVEQDDGQPVTGSVVTQQVAGGQGVVTVVNLGHEAIGGVVRLRAMPLCPPF